MYVFNKEDIKKLHFIKGKDSRSDLQMAVIEVIKKFVESKP